MPLMEGVLYKCHVVFLFYKGTQQNMLGMLEITQREPRIYSVNNDTVFRAYLCMAAVCFIFA